VSIKPNPQHGASQHPLALDKSLTDRDGRPMARPGVLHEERGPSQLHPDRLVVAELSDEAYWAAMYERATD
jgi:hypothetical protein